MELRPWEYAAVFAGSIGFALFLSPMALKAALRWRLLDRPSLHGSEKSPVPYLGGAAIVISFALVVLGLSLLRPPSSGSGELALILGLAVLLSVLGLADDLWALSPWLRLGVETAAAVAVWWSGTGASLFGNPVVDVVVTVVWVVGVTNAFNLLDNMDGLSAGVSTIAALVFFAIAVTNGQFLVATLSIAVAGCAAGFLRSNFHPAKLYMGDAGSLFLGFLLAVIGLKLRFPGPTQITFFVPILVLGVPLFDTVLVTINRILHRRSPLSGGKDHTSHRLVAVGIPIPVAVSLIYAGAASFGWLGIVMANVERSTGFLLMAWILAVASFSGVLLSVVPVYESSRRRHIVLQEMSGSSPGPPY